MNFKKISIYYFFCTLLTYSFYKFIGQSLIPALGNYSSYILLFLDLSLVCLGLCSIKVKQNKFVMIILVIFICSSTITYLINSQVINIFTHLNGLREFFIIFGASLFILNVLNSHYFNYFHQKMITFFIFYLYIQIPITFYQYFKYGAGDAVGGAFGVGGSGTLTLIIYLSVFFLLTHFSYRNGFKHIRLAHYFIVLPLLLPTFINETKITFLLIVLLFLYLANFKIKSIPKILSISIIAFGIILLFNKIYYSTVIEEKQSIATTQTGNPIEKIFSEDFLEKYLFNPNTANTDVSRLTKIQIATVIISENYYHLLFGRGFGIFKGGNELGASSFSKKNDWLLGGTIPYLFFLILQGGVINSILIIILICYPFKFINKPPFAIQRNKYFLITIFIFILFYNPAFREGTFTILFIYMVMYLFYHIRFIQVKPFIKITKNSFSDSEPVLSNLTTNKIPKNV